jgi:Flp pilus assembly CpaE family ATPase
MRESKRVFLVCTPEIPSLHLARDKYSYLRSLDLGDRVALVINRSDKRSVVSPAQIEEILGIPVHATFSNDYQGVHRALTAGTMLDPKTALGRQIAAFAGLMAETTPKAVPQTKKRLVEYFTMLPARHTLFPDSRRTAG